MTELNAVWIQCAEIGCTAGLGIDSRHLRNFDGRDWLCREHDAPINAPKENQE